MVLGCGGTTLLCTPTTTLLSFTLVKILWHRHSWRSPLPGLYAHGKRLHPLKSRWNQTQSWCFDGCKKSCIIEWSLEWSLESCSLEWSGSMAPEWGLDQAAAAPSFEILLPYSWPVMEKAALGISKILSGSFFHCLHEEQLGSVKMANPVYYPYQIWLHSSSFLSKKSFSFLSIWIG